jgi:hypothetical protein
MELPPAPSINSRSRSLIASVNRPEVGPAPITRGPRTIGSALRASVGSVETAALTTGAVIGTKLDVPLATRVEERVSDGLAASAHASPAGARRPRAGRWYMGIVRSFAAASPAGDTMQRADLTTRWRSRPSPRVASTSRRPRVGSCDHDRPGRRVHARRLARGSRRWAIRWAKPGRIGPYRAVSGPSPLARDATGYCLFAGTFGPDAATNAMLHTREAAGSKPAAPIQKV